MSLEEGISTNKQYITSKYLLQVEKTGALKRTVAPPRGIFHGKIPILVGPTSHKRGHRVKEHATLSPVFGERLQLWKKKSLRAQSTSVCKRGPPGPQTVSHLRSNGVFLTSFLLLCTVFRLVFERGGGGGEEEKKEEKEVNEENEKEEEEEIFLCVSKEKPINIMLVTWCWKRFR